MSQKVAAFDKIDKDIVDSKAATDRLLRERRSLTEVLGKDLTPRESFDMRLKQLSLEYPHWDCSGREDGEAARDDRGREYTIYIENCEEEETKALDWLKDPRYYLSSTVEGWEVHGPDLGGTCKSIATLNLEFEDNDPMYSGDDDDEAHEEDDE